MNHDDHRSYAAYLLELRDELDALRRPAGWRSGAVAAAAGLAAMGFMAYWGAPLGFVGSLAVFTVLPGSYVIAAEWALRKERRTLLSRIEAIEQRRRTILQGEGRVD